MSAIVYVHIIYFYISFIYTHWFRERGLEESKGSGGKNRWNYNSDIILVFKVSDERVPDRGREKHLHLQGAKWGIQETNLTHFLLLSLSQNNELSYMMDVCIGCFNCICPNMVQIKKNLIHGTRSL